VNLSTAQVDTVLLKVASRCNIDCTYCYVYNMGDEGWRSMPALVSEETTEVICRRLLELRQWQTHRFAVVLHGGEPLMLGARRLEQLLKSLRYALPSEYPIGIQTNGVLLTREILDACANADVTLSVSVDGPEVVHDRFRIGKKGEGTHAQTVAGVALLREHQSSDRLFSGVLAVIDPFSDPGLVYRYLKGLGAPSIDFLYRDGNHSKLPFGKLTVDSTEYAQWLTGLLDVYLADPQPPRIRFLDDLMRLTMGGRGIKEGLGEADYGILIVDTDGSITKNDTLKSTRPGADRFDEKWSVHTHSVIDILATDEFRQYYALQQPTAAKCRSCPELRVCGGGMPLHRWSDANGLGNPSVYCADQLALIGAIRQRLKRAGLAA
jgi:uncharacterized protein